MGPNDEVEGRGASPTTNEADLFQSSTPSLADRRRPPRSLEPIVMCCPSRRAETPWDFESTQLPNQHRVLASRGDGLKVAQRGLFAERWLRETRGILRTEQIAPHRPATAKNRAAIYSTLQPAKCFLQALRISSACASTRCCAARICWSVKP